MVEYSPEIAQEVLERVALGENVDCICQDEHIPNKRDIYQWMQENEDFANDYARARAMRAETRVDRIDGYRRACEANKMPSDVARLCIDAEKWQAGKESPKYSDKTQIEHTITNGLSKLSTDRLLRLEREIARMLGTAALVIPPEPKKLSQQNMDDNT